MTKEQHAFIVANHKGIGNKRLMDMFNRQFSDTPINFTALAKYRNKHNLKSGLIGHYKNGSIPYNKGLKWKDFMSEEGIAKVMSVNLQKGLRPHNSHNIGDEALNSNGYIRIKVAEPDIWKYKQILVWEDYHKKKVPKGNMVIFLDGNNRNFDIDNLMLVSRQESGIINMKKLRYADTELTKSVVGITRLEIAIRERGK